MESLQIWRQAILRVAASTADSFEARIIKLFFSEVGFILDLDIDKVRFLCSSEYALHSFSPYSWRCFNEVKRLLHNPELGVSLELMSSKEKAKLCAQGLLLRADDLSSFSLEPTSEERQELAQYPKADCLVASGVGGFYMNARRKPASFSLRDECEPDQTAANYDITLTEAGRALLAAEANSQGLSALKGRVVTAVGKRKPISFSLWERHTQGKMGVGATFSPSFPQAPAPQDTPSVAKEPAICPQDEPIQYAPSFDAEHDYPQADFAHKDAWVEQDKAIFPQANEAQVAPFVGEGDATFPQSDLAHKSAWVGQEHAISPQAPNVSDIAPSVPSEMQATIKVEEPTSINVAAVNVQEPKASYEPKATWSRLEGYPASALMAEYDQAMAEGGDEDFAQVYAYEPDQVRGYDPFNEFESESCPSSSDFNLIQEQPTANSSEEVKDPNLSREAVTDVRKAGDFASLRLPVSTSNKRLSTNRHVAINREYQSTWETDSQPSNCASGLVFSEPVQDGAASLQVKNRQRLTNIADNQTYAQGKSVGVEKTGAQVGAKLAYDQVASVPNLAPMEQHAATNQAATNDSSAHFDAAYVTSPAAVNAERQSVKRLVDLNKDALSFPSSRDFRLIKSLGPDEEDKIKLRPRSSALYDPIIRPARDELDTETVLSDDPRLLMPTVEPAHNASYEVNKVCDRDIPDLSQEYLRHFAKQDDCGCAGKRALALFGNDQSFILTRYSEGKSALVANDAAEFDQEYPEAPCKLAPIEVDSSIPQEGVFVPECEGDDVRIEDGLGLNLPIAALILSPEDVPYMGEAAKTNQGIEAFADQLNHLAQSLHPEKKGDATWYDDWFKYGRYQSKQLAQKHKDREREFELAQAPQAVAVVAPAAQAAPVASVAQAAPIASVTQVEPAVNVVEDYYGYAAQRSEHEQAPEPAYATITEAESVQAQATGYHEQVAPQAFAAPQEQVAPQAYAEPQKANEDQARAQELWDEAASFQGEWDRLVAEFDKTHSNSADDAHSFFAPKKPEAQPVNAAPAPQALAPQAYAPKVTPAVAVVPAAPVAANQAEAVAAPKPASRFNEVPKSVQEITRYEAMAEEILKPTFASDLVTEALQTRKQREDAARHESIAALPQVVSGPMAPIYAAAAKRKRNCSSLPHHNALLNKNQVQSTSLHPDQPAVLPVPDLLRQVEQDGNGFLKDEAARHQLNIDSSKLTQEQIEASKNLDKALAKEFKRVSYKRAAYKAKLIDQANKRKQAQQRNNGPQLLERFEGYLPGMDPVTFKMLPNAPQGPGDINALPPTAPYHATLQQDTPPELLLSVPQVEINPVKTFSTYVSDNSNFEVLNAASLMAKYVGVSQLNPFFVYGESGVGKTHVLHAIANAINYYHPDYRVALIRAEEFIQNYVSSITESGKNRFANSQVYFQQAFLEYDVLIFDDIQALMKGTKSRQVFFEVVSSFLERPGTQLIVAASVIPRTLKERGFEDNLISRISSGLCLPLIKPTWSNRRDIVNAKCQEMGINMSEEIVDYISTNMNQNVSEIEGALKTMHSFLNSNGSLTFDDAVRTLSGFIGSGSGYVLTISDIQSTVAKEFGIAVKDLLSSCKKKAVSQARSLAMTICRDVINNNSLNDLGRAFKKDHTSVHEAIVRTRTRLRTDSSLKEKYDHIVKTLAKMCRKPAKV